MKLCALISLAWAMASTGDSPATHPTEATPASRPPTLAVEAAFVLNVSNARGAADALIDKAGELGGYFTQRDEQSIALKVPTARLDELRTFCETLGTVLQRTQQAFDLRLQLAQQNTLIKSKREMLERYIDVLESANAQSLVAVEQQVTALVAEIEHLRGSTRLLEHRLQMANLRVSFQLEQRVTPPSDGTSPFPWLNTLNLVDLYRDFSQAD